LLLEGGNQQLLLIGVITAKAWDCDMLVEIIETKLLKHEK
jgi:hypothetical protein